MAHFVLLRMILGLLSLTVLGAYEFFSHDSSCLTWRCPLKKNREVPLLNKERSASCFWQNRERDGLSAGSGAIDLINRRANVSNTQRRLYWPLGNHGGDHDGTALGFSLQEIRQGNDILSFLRNQRSFHAAGSLCHPQPGFVPERAGLVCARGTQLRPTTTDRRDI